MTQFQKAAKVLLGIVLIGFMIVYPELGIELPDSVISGLGSIAVLLLGITIDGKELTGNGEQ